MPLTIAPSDEALTAITALVNAGSTYTLYRTATYSREFIDDNARPAGLLVDVVHDSERNADDSIDQEPPTVHQISVWMRDQLADTANATVAAKTLIFRKLFRQINVHLTANSRVAIWDCDADEKEVPDKDILNDHFYFRARIILSVEVAPA